MVDKRQPDLPVLLRAATVLGLLAAVIGTVSLAWMADAALGPDANATANALKAMAKLPVAQEFVMVVQQVVGTEP